MENTTENMVNEFIKKQKFHQRKSSLVKTSKGVKCVLVQTVPAHIFKAYVVEDGYLADAGILTFSHDDDIPTTIELSTIEVEKNYQNLGIGSLLVKKFLTYANNNGGYKKITLTSFSNTAEFFEKFGFEAKTQKAVTADEHKLISMDLALVKNYNQQCVL